MAGKTRAFGSFQWWFICDDGWYSALCPHLDSKSYWELFDETTKSNSSLGWCKWGSTSWQLGLPRDFRRRRHRKYSHDIPVGKTIHNACWSIHFIKRWLRELPWIPSIRSRHWRVFQTQEVPPSAIDSWRHPMEYNQRWANDLTYLTTTTAHMHRWRWRLGVPQPE